MTDDVTREFYSISDANIQTRYVGSRRAARWVPFFLPHLRSGLSLLDCGCGVGSITLDLAEIVAPGPVIGVDMDESQLQIARESAAERGLTNISFEQGNVYDLRFDEGTFDRVLAHTLVFHLSDPLRALKEMRRVTKRGGIVAVSDDDYNSVSYSPEHPLARKGLDLWTRVMVYNGASPFYSRHLRGLMLEAGFASTEGYAVSAEAYGTPEETRWVAPLISGVFRNPDLIKVAVSQGWATETELKEIAEWFIAWGERPDAFFAELYCAALGFNG